MRTDISPVLETNRQRQFLLMLAGIFLLVTVMLSAFIKLTDKHSAQNTSYIKAKPSVYAAKSF